MGGTAGAIITCPLEVVKTRLQATDSGFGSNPPPPPSKSETLSSKKAAVGSTTNTSTSGSIRNSIFHPEVARGHMQITVPVASLHSKASISSTPTVRWSSTATLPQPPPGGGSMGVAQCLKHIFMHEGIPGLFKGLGPNLMGVFPRYRTRASNNRGFYYFFILPHVGFSLMFGGIPLKSRSYYSSVVIIQERLLLAGIQYIDEKSRGVF